MALLDVVQARVDRRHRLVRVDCGELARLPSDRAVPYAPAGSRKRRQIPCAGAGSPLLLTRSPGTAPTTRPHPAHALSGDQRRVRLPACFRGRPDTARGPGDKSASRTENGKIRLDTVQAENHICSESRHARKIGISGVRPDTVQEKDKIRTSVGPVFPEIRLPSVQIKPGAPAAHSGAGPV